MIFGRRDRFGLSRKRSAADARDQHTAGKAAMDLRRWTLNQAVAWVATRSAEAVSQNGSGTRLAAWVALFPGSYPIPRYDDAWRELAAEMASGTVSAIGAEIQRDRVDGSRLERPGVQFPPADQPGLGVACFVANEPPRTVVRPERWQFAARWTEYADLSLERAAVMAVFPAAIGLAAVEDVRMTQAPIELPQARQPRPGSQEARVRQLIGEAFPGGVGQVTDSAIRAALRSKFNDADRGIQDHTIRRAIKAVRADEAA